LAQSDANRGRPPGPSIPTDARQIIGPFVAATERNWQAQSRYTHVERDESLRLDPAGRVKSREVDVSRILLVNGAPFEQMLEHNGRPLSPHEEAQQEQKIEKQRRETPEDREARLANERESRSLIRELPAAFDFQLIGEDVVDGRPAYVLQASPRPGYQPHGKYGRIFSKVEGRLWVDKQDLGWIKIEGQVIQSFSLGVFLARVQRGSQISMEQTRLADGIWVPARVDVRASAKLLFVKSLLIERVLTYSDYRIADADLSAASPAANNAQRSTLPVALGSHRLRVHLSELSAPKE
jgi:hypothetical protein